MTAYPGNDGLLVIRQPERGYRFSIDSVLLAGFAAPHCRGHVLDLGTGCGVLLLLLSRLAPGMDSGTGVEIQPSLCAFAERNFRESGSDRRLRAVRGDYRREAPGAAPGAFDLVVANPPYGRAGHGRRNPHPQREAARHEIHGSLQELIDAAARYLAPAGRFALILPHDRFPEVQNGARRAGMGIGEMRRVHAWKEAPPSRGLFLLARGAGERPMELPPLSLHDGGGKYCPEVERICRLFRPPPVSGGHS
ncbi:MAG TPA: methyltransferase [Candidatus Deferrimicrobiaceae bacterium]